MEWLESHINRTYIANGCIPSKKLSKNLSIRAQNESTAGAFK